MTTLTQQHGARAVRRPTSIADVMKQALSALWLWQFRSRTRNHLARLDDHLLRDIGMDPAMRATEVAKPFWRS